MQRPARCTRDGSVVSPPSLGAHTHRSRVFRSLTYRLLLSVVLVAGVLVFMQEAHLTLSHSTSAVLPKVESGAVKSLALIAKHKATHKLSRSVPLLGRVWADHVAAPQPAAHRQQQVLPGVAALFQPADPAALAVPAGSDAADTAPETDALRREGPTPRPQAAQPADRVPEARLPQPRGPTVQTADADAEDLELRGAQAAGRVAGRDEAGGSSLQQQWAQGAGLGAKADGSSLEQSALAAGLGVADADGDAMDLDPHMAEESEPGVAVAEADRDDLDWQAADSADADAAAAAEDEEHHADEGGGRRTETEGALQQAAEGADHSAADSGDSDVVEQEARAAEGALPGASSSDADGAGAEQADSASEHGFADADDLDQPHPAVKGAAQGAEDQGEGLDLVAKAAEQGETEEDAGAGDLKQQGASRAAGTEADTTAKRVGGGRHGGGRRVEKPRASDAAGSDLAEPAGSCVRACGDHGACIAGRCRCSALFTGAACALVRVAPEGVEMPGVMRRGKRWWTPEFAGDYLLHAQSRKHRRTQLTVRLPDKEKAAQVLVPRSAYPEVVKALPLHDEALGHTVFESCAVVGSSGILLNYEHGPKIDQHEMVMRFNSAPTKGFERHAGSKTTHRITNTQNWGFRESDSEIILMHLRAGSSVKGLLYNAKQRRPMRLWALDPDWVEYMAWSFNFLATSGLHGIMLALQRCQQVRLYGFHVSMQHGALYHYYDDCDVPANVGRDDSEFLVLKFLVEAGWVTLGEPCILECHGSKKVCEECKSSSGYRPFRYDLSKCDPKRVSRGHHVAPWVRGRSGHSRPRRFG